MNHAALFSGLGGFNLAARWMGWRNIFDVEIDPDCQKILSKNFPETYKYYDIKKFQAQKYKGAVDIISGGFPCQPFSVSGLQKGTADARFLWGEMLRIIQEIKPTYVVAENVGGLLTIQNGLVFEQVQLDLENEGFQVQAYLIPACAVDAPHRRDRIWIVAYSHSNRQAKSQYQRQIVPNNQWNSSPSEQGRFIVEYGFSSTTSNAPHFDSARLWFTGKQESVPQIEWRTRCNIFNAANPNSKRRKGSNYVSESEKRFRRNKAIRDLSTPRYSTESRIDINHFGKDWISVASELCRVDDGVSVRLDGFRQRRRAANRNARIKALGNAIVPQVAYNIFNAIQSVHNE